MAGCRSPVEEFYNGKTVFLTGGTGFMGKVLIERLLMSCPGLKKIIVLIRLKQGENQTQRLAKLKESQAFQVLRRLHPDRLNKLHALEGDLELPDLGLSRAGRELLKEAHVIFNMAATLNFNEDLRKSLTVNVLATKALLEMCLTSKTLRSFVHVSTAYANCDQDRIEERIYPSPANLTELTKLCEQCGSDKDVLELTKRLLGKRPNTYTLTKAIAETVVGQFSSEIPVAIVRPSMVTAALRCPHPGWVDCRAGATGIVALGGSGLWRVALGDGRTVLDLVPVDIVANAIVVVAWRTASAGTGEPTVYNITSGRCNPVRFREVASSVLVHSKEIPLETAVWYPSVQFTTNRFFFNVGHFLMHLVPAYLHDVLSPSSTKLSLLREHRNISKAAEAFSFFWCKSFDFGNENMRRLLGHMSEHDRATFFCDIKEVQWHLYLGAYLLGVRRYLLGQADDTLPRSKRRMDMYTNIHRAVKMAMMAGAAYYMAVKLKTIYCNIRAKRDMLQRL